VLSNPIFEQLVRARTTFQLEQVIPLFEKDLNNPKSFHGGTFGGIHEAMMQQQTINPLQNSTFVSSRPTKRENNLHFFFNQQTNTTTSNQAEVEVRRFLKSQGLSLQSKSFLSNFSHYYNHFRKVAAQETEKVDLYGTTTISIEELQNKIRDREDAKVFVVSPSSTIVPIPLVDVSTSWTVCGEIVYLAKSYVGSRKELLFHKFEELEADLICYLSQHTDPHPIDLVTRNLTWGLIAIASTQSMDHLVSEVEEKIEIILSNEEEFRATCDVIKLTRNPFFFIGIFLFFLFFLIIKKN
jgi:hypothetical protein